MGTFILLKRFTLSKYYFHYALISIGFLLMHPLLLGNFNISNIYLGYPGGIGLNEIDKFKDGGLTDNYGNMSTHEKLMRMASKMYG